MGRQDSERCFAVTTRGAFWFYEWGILTKEFDDATF